MKEYLPLFLIYLLIINIITAVIFIGDKKKAKKKRQRVPERTLHLLEFAGGWLAVLILMQIIRHKNRKRKYYIWTYIALAVWVAVCIFALA